MGIVNRKGTASVALTVRVPCIMRVKEGKNPDGSIAPIKVIRTKILKSKLRACVTKKDIINAFYANPEDIHDSFLDDEEIKQQEVRNEEINTSN